MAEGAWLAAGEPGPTVPLTLPETIDALSGLLELEDDLSFLRGLAAVLSEVDRKLKWEIRQAIRAGGLSADSFPDFGVPIDLFFDP